MKIIITGSAGFVGASLYCQLKKNFEVLGIDRKMSPSTDVIADIGDDGKVLKKHIDHGDVIINCAAARFDFDIKADEYLDENVINHCKFLECLDGIKISYFVHISSVASLDGQLIEYSSKLDCDDAYRATKYLQENAIEEY